MYAIGIDLGTSSIKVAMLDAAGNPVVVPNADGELSSPSTVLFGPGGEILHGREANNCRFLYPDCHVSNAKRWIGTDQVLAHGPGDVEYHADDIAELLFGRAKSNFEARTGMVATHVAVGVPATYDQRQRQEVKDAAEAAGFTVVALPHEPTAAALGNLVHKRGDGLCVVVDLGGGTLDVSGANVSGNTIEVVSTHGSQDCGGVDFCLRLGDLLLKQFEAEHGLRPAPDQFPVEMADFEQRTESLMQSLSSRTEARIPMAFGGRISTLSVTRGQFEAVCPDLVAKVTATVRAALMQAGGDSRLVKEVLLVGGGGRIPMVVEAIQQMLGIQPIMAEPIFGCAMGCAMVCRMEMERQGIPVHSGAGLLLPPINYYLNEILPHAVGVTVLTEDRRREVMGTMLNKGQRVPCDHTATFQLAEAGQATARIELLQGEAGADRGDCMVLGHVDMTDLPPVSTGPHPVQVRVRADRSGMLTVTGHDTVSDKSFEMTVDNRRAGTADNGSQPSPAAPNQAA